MALNTTSHPVVFFSYSHFDDEHDRADLSRLRDRFERELRAQSGAEINVFHDRRDIHWGHAWKRRINETIEMTSFLVPIITPSFLASAECRRELESFREREQRLAHDDLILPIYYIEVPALETPGAADDDPLVALLKSRQYVDWRSLRHKSLNSAQGRKAVSELARRFLGAVQRLSSPTASIANPGFLRNSSLSAPVSRQRATSVPVPDTDDALLTQLVDRDPLVAFHAASVMVNRPDLLHRVADVSATSPIGEAAVRVVTRRHPKGSAEMLLPRIANAGNAWAPASRVTAYFDPALAPYCEATLGEFAKKGHIDRQRLSIEALGYCGSPGWAYQLRELLEGDDSYELRKLGSYVLEALARFVVRSPTEGGPNRVRFAADAFKEELAHLEQVHNASVIWLRLLTILLDCDGRHADALIGWLNSPSKSVSNLGAELLGYLRIFRAVEPITRVLETSGDESSRRYCADALARIGTPAAIRRLLGVKPGSRESTSLAFAVDNIADAETFDRVAATLLSEAGALSYLAVRAVGRRPNSRLQERLALALDSLDALTRGCAVLALARRGAIDERRVRVAREQAADHTEHILSTVGLLALASATYPEVEEDLRVRLAKDSFAWMPQLQLDVLEILRGTGRSDAGALASAWQPFYRLAAVGG